MGEVQLRSWAKRYLPAQGMDSNSGRRMTYRIAPVPAGRSSNGSATHFVIREQYTRSFVTQSRPWLLRPVMARRSTAADMSSKLNVAHFVKVHLPI